MKDTSLYQLGGVSSVLVGISYVVMGATQLLLPAEFTAQNNVRMPIMFFEPYRVLFMTQWGVMALGAVFALAMVPAVSATVLHLGEGWVRWTSTLAILGFAVTILDNYWAIAVTPATSAAYSAGNAIARTALDLPTAPQAIDVQGWLGYGAVGLWFLVVNLLAWRGRVWPRLLAGLGFAGAIGYFLVVVSNVVPEARPVGLLVAGLGGIVIAPIWYGWMGILLYRTSLHGRYGNRDAVQPAPSA